MSILRMVIASPILSFNSFNIGGIILQGPHHSAEKSIRTGFSAFIISWKFAMAFYLWSNTYYRLLFRHNLYNIYNFSNPYNQRSMQYLRPFGTWFKEIVILKPIGHTLRPGVYRF